jgi:hypothetical protein
MAEHRLTHKRRAGPKALNDQLDIADHENVPVKGQQQYQRGDKRTNDLLSEPPFVSPQNRMAHTIAIEFNVGLQSYESFVHLQSIPN